MKRQWILVLLMGLFSMPLEARALSRSPWTADGFEAERATAVKELIAGLESYVEWCSSKKIWVERNRALKAILAIDPGNMSAKRGLGWQQVADGVWEPPAEPKPAKNFDLAALKDAPTRYAEAIRPWRDHLVRLVEEHRKELTQVQVDSAYAEILSLNPDDEVVRTARGETRGEKGWVLTQTVQAKARRGEIKNIVKEALEGAQKIEEVVPSAYDMGFKVDWQAHVGNKRVRVFSTGDRDEAVRCAQVLQAACDVFNRVFGTAVDLGEGFTVYLLCDESSKKTFIDNIPNATETHRKFYAQIEGTGFKGSNSAAWWSTVAERRLDGITRHAIGAMFQVEFALGVEVAWAWEGLGLYLTRELIGTRLTWYIVLEEQKTASKTKVGADWMKKLVTPGTNWMNEGFRLVRFGDAASLTSTLTRPLNKMTPQDLFVSYTVGAYLLEAEALRLPALLRLLGGTSNNLSLKTPLAWKNALSMDLDTFAAKLERWLGERR